jgi:hypothetical protein
MQADLHAVSLPYLDDLSGEQLLDSILSDATKPAERTLIEELCATYGESTLRKACIELEGLDDYVEHGTRYIEHDDYRIEAPEHASKLHLAAAMVHAENWGVSDPDVVAAPSYQITMCLACGRLHICASYPMGGKWVRPQRIIVRPK